MFKPITVKRNICKCERCGYEWISLGGPLPIACSKCKNRYWNIKKKNKKNKR